MTERLAQLLHDETDHLDVPPVAAEAALARGRGMRGRRAAVRVGGVVAALAVVGGVALTVTGDDDPAGITVADTPPVADVPAFGFRSEVYLGDTVGTVPDTVHSLHYTSEGVLVRSNPNDGASDGSGPESLTLVRYDGTTVALGTVPEGVGPATDPTEPVYVLAEARGGGFVAVVRDVTTGGTVDEVPLPDLPPSYWDVPPLALDGDTLYAGYESETASIDLETGQHHVVPGMGGGIPDVVEGRTVSGTEASISVLDAASGDVVRSFDVGQDSWGTLSPDGRHLAVSTFGKKSFGYITTVYDVDSGRPVDLSVLGDDAQIGWTAAGNAFTVSRGRLTTCDVDSGDCTTRQVSLPGDAFARLGGRTYES